MATRLPEGSLGCARSWPTTLLNMSLRCLSRVLKFSTPVLPPTIVASLVKFSGGDRYVSKGTAREVFHLVIFPVLVLVLVHAHVRPANMS